MNGLVEYFIQHQDFLLYSIAGICLVVELSVLGMSGPLLFLALGCLFTGVMVTAGIISSWQMEVLGVGLLSALSAVLLWKPLKGFQNAGSGRDTSSDMIGKILPVTHAISHFDGSVGYSGIDWPARLDPEINETIAAGNRVQVVGVDGSLLLVKLA